MTRRDATELQPTAMTSLVMKARLEVWASQLSGRQPQQSRQAASGQPLKKAQLGDLAVSDGEKSREPQFGRPLAPSGLGVGSSSI
jgi:hypothetical protein